jgi:ABC-type transport system involved in Fe-S cluster assembly fused permease/ATPase subunit
MLEAGFSLFGGIGFGFYFCWQMAICALGAMPIIVISSWVNYKFDPSRRTKKKDVLADKAEENSKSESDLIADDAIMNYKTIASFGSDEIIVEEYSKLLDAGAKSHANKHML